MMNQKMINSIHVLDLTGEISRACSGSDFEVARSSSDNEGFDTKYPIDVKKTRYLLTT
jgi:hypothetical protein